MRKGKRVGPALLRLTIALFAVAVLAVAAKEVPARRRSRGRKSA
ncbi:MULTISPECIES: hypothetical protein [Actinomadura]|nr:MULTISPECIES: hypothetical protein [Actinomadura]